MDSSILAALIQTRLDRSVSISDAITRSGFRLKQVRQQDAYPANVGGGRYNYVQHPRPPPFKGKLGNNHRWLYVSRLLQLTATSNAGGV